MDTKNRPRWVTAVQKAFKNGPPQGNLLAWDRDRFRSLIQEAARPQRVVNATSFDYAFCNTYDVEMPGPRKGASLVITVQVSFIVDAFSVHATGYDSPTTGNVLHPPYPEEVRSIVERVRNALVAQGFTEATDEDHDIPVPGVTLELSGSDNVTLSKCLFQDYEG